jgi:hypothetical protein
MKILFVAVCLLSPDAKVGIGSLIVAAFMFGWSWIMYDKGRRDERFRQNYLCLDCGDFRDDSSNKLCIDCQRKLLGRNGTMRILLVVCLLILLGLIVFDGITGNYDEAGPCASFPWYIIKPCSQEHK